MADSNGKVMFISGDLMFASRVRAAAENAGWSFAIGGKVPTEDGDSIRYVVLDLATMSKQIEAVTATCAETCPDARLIAYGPHVQVQVLDAARAAGITEVMTRGQFDRELQTLFQPSGGQDE